MLFTTKEGIFEMINDLVIGIMKWLSNRYILYKYLKSSSNFCTKINICLNIYKIWLSIKGTKLFYLFLCTFLFRKISFLKLFFFSKVSHNSNGLLYMTLIVPIRRDICKFITNKGIFKMIKDVVRGIMK